MPNPFPHNILPNQATTDAAAIELGHTLDEFATIIAAHCDDNPECIAAVRVLRTALAQYETANRAFVISVLRGLSHST